MIRVINDTQPSFLVFRNFDNISESIGSIGVELKFVDEVSLGKLQQYEWRL